MTPPTRRLDQRLGLMPVIAFRIVDRARLVRELTERTPTHRHTPLSLNPGNVAIIAHTNGTVASMTANHSRATGILS
jgi:hypothetical protein